MKWLLVFITTILLINALNIPLFYGLFVFLLLWIFVEVTLNLIKEVDRFPAYPKEGKIRILDKNGTVLGYVNFKRKKRWFCQYNASFILPDMKIYQYKEKQNSIINDSFPIREIFNFSIASDGVSEWKVESWSLNDSFKKFFYKDWSSQGIHFSYRYDFSIIDFYYSPKDNTLCFCKTVFGL